MIQLRCIEEIDLPILFEFQRDRDANLMAAFPARDHAAFFEHWRKKILPDESVWKNAVIAGGNVVGDIVSWESDGKRLVGYWIGKQYWGKGYASAALSEFLKQLTIRPLYAYAAKHNVASIRVLEKCGFLIAEHSTFFSEPHGHDVPEVLLVLKS